MGDLPRDLTILGGGTGTPKLLLDDRNAGRDAVTVVANTGDDVEFGDLFVSPDVDSCLFAAAGRLDRTAWWGITDDPTVTAAAIERYAGQLDLDDTPRFRPSAAQEAGRPIARWRRFEPVPEFMTFGDEDRAIHRVRAAALDRGLTLTEVTRGIAAALDVRVSVLPMSDDPVTTLVHTPDGFLHFQEYWVARRGAVEVESVEFRGADSARPTPAVEAALDATAVVVGPSNPVTSIGPILALPGVTELLSAVPVVAVSPFIGEDAFSGPAADLMAVAGLPVGSSGLEEAYPFVDALVLDEADPAAPSVPTVATDIRIDDAGDAERVWRAIATAIDTVS